MLLLAMLSLFRTKSRVDNFEGETRNDRRTRSLSRRDEAVLAILDRLTFVYVQIFITLIATKTLVSLNREKAEKSREQRNEERWPSFSLFLSLSLSNNQNGARWLIPPLITTKNDQSCTNINKGEKKTHNHEPRQFESFSLEARFTKDFAFPPYNIQYITKTSNVFQ